MSNTCWRCQAATDKKYGNGMCIDCYTECAKASEVHEQMINDFEEGELSTEAFNKEHERRLSHS